MSKPLPSRPNLEQLRKQAKELLKSAHDGEPFALKRFEEVRVRPAKSSETGVAKFSLSDAQFVIAREYGFSRWLDLKEHIESLLLETSDPLELFKNAFHQNDAPLFRKLLE